MERHWIDWTSAFLPEAGAWLTARFAGETLLDMHDVVCVTPGRRAGRILLAQLARLATEAGLDLVPPREVAEERAIEAEEEAEALGDGEDELSMRDRGADVLGDVLGHEQGALLVAAWAQAPAPAGEGDEELVAARSAAHPREAVTQVDPGTCPRIRTRST